MQVKEALKITDSFTRTSKMPGLSYSLPAWACKTGQKLAKIPGTPCFGCYAMKGNYTRYQKKFQVITQKVKTHCFILRRMYNLKHW